MHELSGIDPIFVSCTPLMMAFCVMASFVDSKGHMPPRRQARLEAELAGRDVALDFHRAAAGLEDRGVGQVHRHPRLHAIAVAARQVLAGAGAVHERLGAGDLGRARCHAA
jgi:hypothetical protein